ncbi:MAG TPA: hypothetical protein DCR93_32520 [Cytophagales bacterium]|nr:hypothetical protein [Cytophagales bacterium]
MSQLYTFILDFRGGTYTTQVTAPDMEASLSVWLDQLALEMGQIQDMGPMTVGEIKEQLITEKTHTPVALQGLSNVWYVYLSTRQGFSELHIVSTLTG